MGHPERIVPDHTESGVVALHEARYRFALPSVERLDVLDAACGVGYGTALLATTAARVVGVDRSAEAVTYARQRYGASNISFYEMDVMALDLPAASFDAVCSFETIEHLADPAGFLTELARVLRPGGRLFVSTPRVETTTHSPANPFHALELSRTDFECLLSAHFVDIRLHGQHRLETRRHKLLRRLDVLGLRRHSAVLRRAAAPLVGSRPIDSLTPADIAIDPDRLEDATELLAVCTRP